MHEELSQHDTSCRRLQWSVIIIQVAEYDKMWFWPTIADRILNTDSINTVDWPKYFMGDKVQHALPPQFTLFSLSWTQATRQWASNSWQTGAVVEITQASTRQSSTELQASTPVISIRLNPFCAHILSWKRFPSAAHDLCQKRRSIAADDRQVSLDAIPCWSLHTSVQKCSFHRPYR